jgi:DNA-binding SARP family transcriptional activator
MLRLTTFGGLALTREEKPLVGKAGRPRNLALLAILAAAGARGESRESLSALFWPDSGADDARHSLGQALSDIRGSTGVADLFEGMATLHLNRSRIVADVWDFEAAVHGRQLERAAAIYRGPFADGVSAATMPEALRRLEDIRTRLAREYGSVLDALAQAATARRDFHASAHWWRLLMEADPTSARVTKKLIEALVAAGERAQALDVARVNVNLSKH